MTLLTDVFKIDGQKLDPNVTERIQSARLIGSMDTDEGAGRVELTIWDGDGQLMREGKLATSRPAKKAKFPDASQMRLGSARLGMDGILHRLSAIDVPLGSPYVTLTFDDEAAALMRRHHRAIVVSRGDKTRAQTIGLAVDTVKEIAIPYRCPEEGIKQHIEAVDDDAEQKGLSVGAHLTIKGVKATREQLKNLETALAVCDRLKAGERATLAEIVIGIAESRWINLTGGDADSQGVDQVRLSTANGITPRTVIDPRTGNVHGAVTRDDAGPVASGKLDPRDIKEVIRVSLLRGFYGKGGAIKIAAENPDMSIQLIAQNVQGSAFSDGSNYAPWVNEAQAILGAWGGVGEVKTLRESKQFQIGGKLNPDDTTEENYWAGSGRLGGEVEGWSRWAWRNQVNFISDEWLFKRKPVFVIGPESVYPALRPADSLAPIVKIGYREDVGVAIAEITIESAARRWDGAPGSAVLLDDLGDISGKWLLRKNDFDLQRDIATITLGRPVTKHPEPAPNYRTVQTTETRTEDTGSPRQKILDVAKRALKLKRYFTYVNARPMHDSLFQYIDSTHGSGPIQVMAIDCSEFTTLVYKAAGVPDPNGRNYDGEGNTSDQRANGKKTNDPQIGDLVHYGTGAAGPNSHVGIYAGDDQVIEIGGKASVSEFPVHYRRDFAGFWTYDLDS